MHRYRIALVSLALLALFAAPQTAAAQDPATDPAQQAAEAARQSACAAPAAPGAPLTISGKGQTQSLPFALDGGAYTVSWSTADPTTISSFINLAAAESLPGETDVQQRLRSAVILNANGKDGSTGETHLFGVKGGKYYLSVRAPSGWTVTFTPLAI